MGRRRCVFSFDVCLTPLIGTLNSIGDNVRAELETKLSKLLKTFTKNLSATNVCDNVSRDVDASMSTACIIDSIKIR